MASFWSMIVHSLFPTLITTGAILYSTYFAYTRREMLFYLVAFGLGISSLHQLAEIETWIKSREVPAPDWWFGDFPETILVVTGVALTFLLANYFERFQNLLDDKDNLQSEIQHRVKNNLQTILSLLSIGKIKLNKPGPEEAIERTQQRVRSIARVHEKLYERSNVKELDASIYFEELCEDFHNAFCDPGHNIELKSNF